MLPSEIGPVRILAIDDDPQARALMEMALAGARFERTLDVAATAAAGLERVLADEHDVYVVDQQLPDGTGVELIRRARGAGINKPFIVITGHGSGDVDPAALREGAADYVEKHSLSAQLERSIRYALRTWQAGRTLLEREEQLRRAEKMEAIGRLAGGVAHDFNNLLTAIIGYTDMIEERLEHGEPIEHDVGEIRKAADRAAELTRQLLNFSRRQVQSPEVIDLNAIVGNMMPMLPRVVGEHVKTTTRLTKDLSSIRADASHLQQVIVNLVLNARDAMPAGGELLVETANVELDRPRLKSERLALPPGRYVLLHVRDSGTGMDQDTLARAFEPFFTTKTKGKGAGFGLATVHGIIEQTGGGISIDSAPGRGTSIRIYLPVSEEDAVRKPQQPAAEAAGGSETLLVVEDNDAVRELAVHALRKRGYTVFEARNGEEALEWWATSKVTAHLLLTDVVMPGLSGPNLAARLLHQNPRLRVVYMSGYTEEATAMHGKFWGGVPLLQKPFTPAQLTERVRLALDSDPDRS